MPLGVLRPRPRDTAQSTGFGIVAVGMTFVILSGGIDLSVGSVIALTTMVSAALVGIVIGVFLGWAFIQAMQDQGLTGAVVPGDQLALMVIGSAVVGVVAALWPAHKAATTPPLAWRSNRAR